MRGTVAVLALLAVATAADARTDRPGALDRALAGRTPGAAVKCIDLSRSNSPQIIDERTILYRESGRRVWRNTLPDACPALGPQRTLIVRVFGTRLCRDDQFQVLPTGSTIPSGVCRLGDFTPYDRVKP